MDKPISVVTGATGHIGYALLKKLADSGENVRILIRKDTKIFNGINCEKVYGDVTDPASLEKAFDGADIVYHLAGHAKNAMCADLFMLPLLTHIFRSPTISL